MATISFSECGDAATSTPPGMPAPIHATQFSSLTEDADWIPTPPGLDMGTEAPVNTTEFPKKQRGTKKAKGQKQVEHIQHQREMPSVQHVAAFPLPRLLGAERLDSFKCPTKAEGETLDQNSNLTSAAEIQCASQDQQEACLRQSAIPPATDHMIYSTPNAYGTAEVALSYLHSGSALSRSELRPPPGLEAYGTSDFVGHGCAATRNYEKNTLDGHNQSKHKPLPSWLCQGQVGSPYTPGEVAPSAPRSALRAKGTEALAKLGAPNESECDRIHQGAALSLDRLRARGKHVLTDVDARGQRHRGAGKTSQKPYLEPKLNHGSCHDHRSTGKQPHGPTMSYSTHQGWATEGSKDQFIDNVLYSGKENLSTESCTAQVPSGMPMKVELASLISV
jgi:hypothetical protein